MARTRNYATEEANYTDATLATSIDNKGTELRVDVREVVNQLIGVAESTALADPVVNQTNGTLNFAATVAVAAQPLTQTQTYQRNYSAFGFTYHPTYRYDPTLGTAEQSTGPANSSPDTTVANGYVQSRDPLSGGTSPVSFRGFRDLELPSGVTVTEITGYFQRVNTNDQITLTCYRQDMSTGAVTSLGTVTSTGTTTGSIQSIAMSLADFTTSNSYGYYLTIASTGGGSSSGVRFFFVKLDYTSPNANARI